MKVERCSRLFTLALNDASQHGDLGVFAVKPLVAGLTKKYYTTHTML